MRLTEKGQVTIPVAIRRELGLRPGDDVEIVVDGDSARIRRSTTSPGRGRRIVDNLRSRGDVPLSTDEIMALTRGE
jgi:AbrB family looped-hinge helix DNA binding protein